MTNARTATYASVSAWESRIIQALCLIIQDNGGRGFGELRVTVKNGQVTHIRRELIDHIEK